RYSCPVSKSIVKSYKNLLNNPKNQLLIYEMYRKKSTFSPVIPASSLKGAIRTALLNREIKNGNVNKNYKMIKKSQIRREEKQLQQDLFDYTNPKNDPFKFLRLTDCLIKGKKNQLIADGVIYKKVKTGGYENLSIKMLFEVINGMNTGGDSYGGCELITKKNNNISEYVIDMEKIIQSCNDFFKNNFDNEYNKFYLSSDNDVLKKTIDYLKEEIDNIKPNSFLVRVGRFSQIENVTLDEPYRAPWNQKGYGNSRTHITSEGIQTPLGWIKVDVQQKQ
ncbi:MAG: type III-A CRISPR-associated RAMP protein Csm5, partial [bacterium]